MNTTINNNMKANEINIEKSRTAMSTNTMPSGSRYKFIMSLGRLLLTTKSQAQYFVSKVNWMDVLNSVDVERIESLLNKYNMSGTYTYTKSGAWVRLQNLSDLKKAIKLEFGI